MNNDREQWTMIFGKKYFLQFWKKFIYVIYFWNFKSKILKLNFKSIISCYFCSINYIIIYKNLIIIIIIIFRMSSSNSRTSWKDFVWKYAIEVSDEKYIRCKFCNQRCTRGVNRLKHNLVGNHYGMNHATKLVKMLD